MFGRGKDKQDPVKQLNSQLKELEQRIAPLQQEFEQRVSEYRQSVAPKWEYLQLKESDVEQNGGLNQLGAAGWELVNIAIVQTGEIAKIFGTHAIYTFKRPVQPLSEDLLEQARELQQLESQRHALATQINSSVWG